MTPQAIIETAVYVDDLDTTEAFYRDVLGLRVIGKEPGRHVFFQAGGSSVLLAFLPEATIGGDILPAHGAKGPGHFAFGIEKASLDEWRQHLLAKGVAVEQEVDWPKGGRSFYFRDPAGN